MVIHDLKHPTETTLNQLDSLKQEVIEQQVLIKRQGRQIKTLLNKLQLFEQGHPIIPLFQRNGPPDAQNEPSN
jgi:hypothetical protein